MIMSDREPIFLFILGRGRSGTSLLQTILNSHPDISVAPEAQFIMFLKNRYANIKWDEEKIKAFHKDLWLEERLHNWHLDKNKLLEALLKRKEDAGFPELCKEVYLQYAHARGKTKPRVIGDKNPHYSLYGEQLKEIFPNALFIHLARDPRDTILSFKQVSFDSNNTATLAYRWNIYNREISKFRNRYPHQFLYIRFEDLLIKPEETLTNICNFLGVQYDPEMLRFYQKEQDWEAEFRKNLKTPLDPSKTYRWKHSMKHSDVLKTNAIIARSASQTGYETQPLKNKPLFQILTFPNYLYAQWVTFLEKLIYKFPLHFSAFVISAYRKLTATKGQMENQK